MRLTKIVATVGPATDSRAQLKKLLKCGVNVFRLNLSHGTHEYHAAAIKRIRSISKTVAILLDTKGPEVRTDELKEPWQIKKGEKVILSTIKTDKSKTKIKVDYKNLPKDVKKGDTILIDDGNIELKVIKKSKDAITCTSNSTAELGSRKSVVVPGVSINLPDITKQDIIDLEFGMKQNVDIIALSLIKSARAINKVRQLCPDKFIVAKIEHPDGVKNIDEILEATDGIMVARGDLGLNLPFEQVPKVQKLLINSSIAAGKPVIVATQMLESMVNSPRPTRAEASDVANAIMDGADAIMLSEETAVGKYPYHAVRTMVKICEATESITHSRDLPEETKEIHEAITKAVIDLEKDGIVKAVLTPTRGGFTPTQISKYRPNIPIFALTYSDAVMRKLALIRGVIQFAKKGHSLIRDAVKYALKNNMLSHKDTVAVVYGKHIKKTGVTNVMELRKVDEIINPKKYHKQD